jgi:hypothetical protein
MANQFIRTINTAFKTTIPPAGVSNIAAHDPLVP